MAYDLWLALMLLALAGVLGGFVGYLVGLYVARRRYWPGQHRLQMEVQLLTIQVRRLMGVGPRRRHPVERRAS